MMPDYSADSSKQLRRTAPLSVDRSAAQQLHGQAMATARENSRYLVAAASSSSGNDEQQSLSPGRVSEQEYTGDDDSGGFDYEIDADALLAGPDSLHDLADAAAEFTPDEPVSESRQSRPAQTTPPSARALRPLMERLEALEEENKQLNGTVERMKSDQEKLRHRYERDRENFRQTLQSELMKQVLPLMDNFERAMEHATAGEINEDFVTGVVLIYKQLSDLLEQNEVVPIMAAGGIFDPEFHEAVIIEPTSGYEPNTVIAELEKGYTHSTRLLRPARVKVAVRPK